MAFSVRNFTTILMITFTICSFTSTKARLDHTHHYIESSTLVTRLNLDGNSTSCWDSLFKLQSCTGELIQFFYNGETYLGPDCCNAILIIVHDCWPAMLGSLGFSAEEVDILRGYCDAEEAISDPIPSSPPSPSHVVESVKDEILD